VPDHQGTGLAVPALAQQPGEVVVEGLALFVRIVRGTHDGDVTEAIGMAGGQVEADHATVGHADHQVDLPTELVGDQPGVVLVHVGHRVALRHELG
jgi:hypothetical protein